MNARFLVFAMPIAAMIGCSQQSVSPTCFAITVGPLVTLLSPQPGATGVAAGPQTLVLATFANGGSNASPVPISVVAGSAAPVLTTATAVPSPLPSGIATPTPAPGTSAAPTIFAVSANLQSSETYTVLSRATIGGCETGTTELDAGTFSTL